MNSANLEIGASTRPASLLAIGLVFARISSTSFGGGQIAAIRREVVRRNRWLSDSEFLELLSVAQITPGANPVNMAVLIGARLGEAAGSAVALLCATVPGFVILMAIALLAFAGAHNVALGGGLRGAAAAAVGLTLANAMEMTLPKLSSLLEITFVAAVAMAVIFVHLSLVLTLGIFVPLSLLAVRANRAR